MAAGRRFVSGLLDELGLDDQRHDAMLLTSELLTNSILHGQGDPRLDVPAGSTRTWRSPSPTAVRGRRGDPPDLGATSGRGLQLLERVAYSYGTRESPTGTTIWFSLRARTPAVPVPRETADGSSTARPEPYPAPT